MEAFEQLKKHCVCRHGAHDSNHKYVEVCRHNDNQPAAESLNNCKKELCPILKKTVFVRRKK